MNLEFTSAELLAKKAAELRIIDPTNNPGLSDPVGDKISPNKGATVASWLEMVRMGYPAHYIGASVLDFCSNNSKTRALVLFSLKIEVVNHVLAELTKVNELKVVYSANLELSDLGKSNLVELCYGDKPFFSDSVRAKMTRERFVFGDNALVVIYCVQKDEFDHVALKSNLRLSLASHTFERRIHGTDGPTDTKYLVEALTNPNTFDLINRVRVSREDRVFRRVPETIRNNPDICIDGSSNMELYGLRKSRDLDLICKGKRLRSELLELGFDVNDGHYKWLPITSDQVIESPYYHVRLYGLKFTSIAVRQLLLSFGPMSANKELTAKKMRDKKLIAMYLGDSRKRGAKAIGLWGTLATQGRLLFEKAVAYVVPRLPNGLAQFLRRLWRAVRSA